MAPMAAVYANQSLRLKLDNFSTSILPDLRAMLENRQIAYACDAAGPSGRLCTRRIPRIRPRHGITQSWRRGWQVMFLPNGVTS